MEQAIKDPIQKGYIDAKRNFDNAVKEAEEYLCQTLKVIFSMVILRAHGPKYMYYPLTFFFRYLIPFVFPGNLPVIPDDNLVPGT